MFARTLELTVKVEKKPDFIKKVKAEILPVLHRQVGFVQMLAFENEIELNKALVVRLWYTQADAERYEKQTFPKIKQILEPFLVTAPVMKVYKVEETISDKLIHADVA